MSGPLKRLAVNRFGRPSSAAQSIPSAIHFDPIRFAIRFDQPDARATTVTPHRQQRERLDTASRLSANNEPSGRVAAVAMSRSEVSR